MLETPTTKPSTLSERSLADLRLICTELQVLECLDSIELITGHLHDFETTGKSKLKTNAEQFKALEAVEIAAKNLTNAIESLEWNQHFEICGRLPPEGLEIIRRIKLDFHGATAELGFSSADCVASYPRKDFHMGRISYIGIEAKRLSKATQEILEKVGDRKPKGGRKQTLDVYSTFIVQISDAIGETHFNHGRGGDFERLCEAIFKAAGVHTGPAGAIRRYLENRKHYENTSDDEPF